MKALILAAGMGTRLAPLTDNCPKALVKVNGESIILKQIQNLYDNDVRDITVIAGYKAELLQETVFNKYPEINIINSIDYAVTNNMYSAYLARKIIGDEEFLMMNADVFCDASVVSGLLDFDAPNAIVTEIGNYIDESMKVIQRDGRIVRIAKTITKEEAFGVSIDIYKFSREGARVFFGKCAEYIEEKKELKLWSEVALNDILSEVVFKACPLVGRWIEIDNHDDLSDAEKLFAK